MYLLRTSSKSIVIDFKIIYIFMFDNFPRDQFSDKQWPSVDILQYKEGFQTVF